MKKYAIFFLVLFGAAFCSQAMAQSKNEVPVTRIPPREDDHFWRKKVVHRIDLDNKINVPLIQATPMDLYEDTGFEENDGIVMGLIHGLKAGKFLAYQADNPAEMMTYDDFVKLARKYDGEEDGEIDCYDCGEEEIYEDPYVDPESITILDEEGDIDPDADGLEVYGDPTADTEDFDVSAYEMVLEVIENQIFDKNRSDVVHDVQYIRLVWVDPSETMPDKYIATFRYAEVSEMLENTRWTNAFNDAEDRNLKEIFELGLYESYAINVSGRGIKSLEESAYRTQQLVQYEHNLWSY